MNANIFTRRRILAGATAWSVAPLLRAEQSLTLPFLTFNIRYANPADGPNRWESRRDTVAEVIGKNSVLAGLQEVLVSQLDDLKSRLPEWEFFSRTREAVDGEGEACPIAWHKPSIEKLDGGTFWLSESPDVPGSKSWESSLPRICTWAKLRHRPSGKVLHLFNIHFDHRSALAREKSGALLAARAAKVDGPAIVAGDFNAVPDSPPTRAFTPEAGWTRAPATAANGEGPGTSNGWKPEGSTHAIDHIFLRGITAQNPVVLRPKTPGGGWASDHFAVKADLVMG
ncbi:MAG: endonuclease/exonuclease/phosphatase family protein [Verrucomicrobiales bacterium]